MLSKNEVGPGKYNIREGRDPLASFHPKKITSNITSFSVAQRPIGAPHPGQKNMPDPT